MPNIILIPAAIAVGSVLLGILMEKFFHAQLMKIAKKSTFKIDDVLIGAFKGMFFLWFLLMGIYFTLLWIFGNTSWMSQMVKVLTSLGILSITIVTMRIATGLVAAYSQDMEGVLPSTSIFANLTKLLVLLIGILIILDYLGISIAPVLTALGVGGLAVALALQDTLSNVFAGINILLSRQIKPGDYIRLDSGEEGFISDISWRNTSLRMMSNNMVLIPNSKLANTIVTNNELPIQEMTVLVNVGVSYGSDLENVESTVRDVGIQVMNEVPGGIPGFEPFIRFSSFSESSIDFNVILKVKSFTDQYLVKHEFIKRLHRRFNEVGIEIPFPIRTVYLQHDD